MNTLTGIGAILSGIVSLGAILSFARRAIIRYDRLEYKVDLMARSQRRMERRMTRWEEEKRERQW